MKDLIKRLKELLTASGLDDAKKKEIEAQVAELEKAAEKSPEKSPEPLKAPVPTDNPEIGAMKELVTALQGQVKGLTDALTAETTARKEQADAIAAQAKKDRDGKITMKLEEAKKKGQITPAQEAQYKKLLENDYDTTVAVMDALPVNAATKQQQKQQEKGNTGNEPKAGTSEEYFSNRESYLEAAKGALAVTKN